MPTENLSALYAERAALAHAIQHAPGGVAFLAEYNILQEHLRVQECRIADTWTWPHTPDPRLPWCSLCGTREYALAVGQIYCVACALTLPPDESLHHGEGAS